MLRSACLVRRTALFASFGFLLAGCGAVLTAGIAGGVFALGGGGKGNSGGGSSRVITASVPFTNTSPVIPLTFTISNANSQRALVEIRFSVTGTDLVSGQPVTRKADDSQVPFPVRPFPDSGPAGLATADPSSTVPNDALLATSPGGTTYTFQWNAARDVGARAYTNNVRLQILLDGVPIFTLSPFSVDNTALPIVTMAVPDPNVLVLMGPGVTVYADAQNSQAGNPGFVPVNLTIMDANSANVSLEVLFNTGTVSPGPYPSTNVAAGELVDVASQQPVPLDAVPTTPGGKSYTFRFRSAANGIATTAPLTSVALQLTATATKTGLSALTPSFAVNNVPFSGALGNAGAGAADVVPVPYALIDAAGELLNVQFAYSTTGLTGVYKSCTELGQPPDQGTQGLLSSGFGISHAFVWNAYQDMLVANGIAATSNVVIRLTVFRPATGVAVGPYFTVPFSVDHRLIHTVFNRQAGVINGIPATLAQLVKPEGVAVLNNKVYFADSGAGVVRVVPFPTPAIPSPTISTFFGGGNATNDGALAQDFSLVHPTDIAADPVPPGALFVCALDPTSVAGGGGKLYRVDGSTPIVTTIGGAVNSFPYLVCFEPRNQLVYYVTFSTASSADEVWSVSPSGGNNIRLAAGTGSAADGPLTNARLTPTGLAANWNIYPNLLFTTEQTTGRIRAINVTGVAASFGPVGVAADSVATITNALMNPVGVSIEGKNAIDVTDLNQQTIFRLDETLATTAIVGSLSGGFNGDAATLARSARLLDPLRIAGDQMGSGLQNPSKGFFFSDSANVRIRVVQQSIAAPIATYVSTFAGSTRDMGDTLPSHTAQLAHPASAVQLGPTTLMVADTFVSRIRAIDERSTNITTFAGNGTSGVAGDGMPVGPGTITGSPAGLVVAPVVSTIYFTQVGEAVIRKLVYGVGPTQIMAVAGIQDFEAYPKSGLPANTQPLAFPQSLAYAGNCVVVGLWDFQNPGIVCAINDSGANQVCANVPIAAGNVAVIAGGGALAPSLAPAPATSLKLGTPLGVTADKNGNVYIADVVSSSIYKLTATGMLSVFAGQPTMPAGYSGDGTGMAATAATFSGCTVVALDEPSENILYVLDSGNSVVRAINVSAMPQTVNGVTINPNAVDRIAGTPGASGQLGDGGAARNAQLSLDPRLAGNMAAVDSATGPVLAFPDAGNNRVCLVTATGIIFTYAGDGSLDGDPTALEPARTPENSNLRLPTTLAVTPSGTYYVVDVGRVRQVTPDNATHVRIAGNAQEYSSPDGPALSTSFAYLETNNKLADIDDDTAGPRQVAIGTVYGTSVLAITDTRSNVVRLMNLASTGSVQPNGMGAIPAGNVATIPFAGLSVPQGVAFTASGAILVSDTQNDRIIAANIGSNAAIALCTSLVLPASGPAIYSPPYVVATLRRPQNLAIGPAPSQSLLLVTVTGGGNPGPYAIETAPSGAGTFAYGPGAFTPGSAPTMIAVGPFTLPRGAALDPSSGDFYFCTRGPAQGWRVINNLSGPGAFAVIGTGTTGFRGDGGLATFAELHRPIAIGVDSRSTIYILDAGNLRVRRCRNFP